jgi:hypothetical protein
VIDWPKEQESRDLQTDRLLSAAPAQLGLMFHFSGFSVSMQYSLALESKRNLPSIRYQTQVALACFLVPESVGS